MDTAQPQREQPMEPWGNRVTPGASSAWDGWKSVATPPHGMTFELPGACGTEHFGELADPCGRDSQAVCLFSRHIRGLSKRGCDRHGFDQTEASQGV